MIVTALRELATNAGRAFLSVHHWKARLLLWTAAAGVGIVAVAFAKLADLSLVGLRYFLYLSPWLPWLTAPVGFFCIAWLTQRFFRGAEGSGIPQTIFALRADAGETGLRLLKPHVVLGRIFLAAVTLLCGGSIGREGPTVHVGAVIAHSVARWMPHGTVGAQSRALILAGGAAGVAAAFNTPLAGIVFAIEELSRSFEERASGATLTAVILAGSSPSHWLAITPILANLPCRSQCRPSRPSHWFWQSPAGWRAGSSAGSLSQALADCRDSLGEYAKAGPRFLPDSADWRLRVLGLSQAVSPMALVMRRRAQSSKRTCICRGCMLRDGRWRPFFHT